MKLFITAVLSSLAFSVVAQGYVLSSDGQPVRDSSGQCVRTGTWTSADRTAECDPRVELPSTQTISSDVLFEFDKSTLTTQGAVELKSLAVKIKPGSHVVIVGHADSIGDPYYNQLLSESRAAVVADFLHSVTTDADYHPSGVGSTQPLSETAQCASVKNFSKRVACYAPERRVVIDIK
jgi:OOP family OmpA-OmpF porin